MGAVQRAAERSRAGFLRRISPALNGVLEPDEHVVAWGYSMQRPSRGMTMVLGGLSGLAIKHYCVALTERRLILVRMVNVGTTGEVERTSPIAGVEVLGARKTFLDVRITIRIQGETYALRFPGAYKRDGALLAATLGHPVG